MFTLGCEQIHAQCNILKQTLLIQARQKFCLSNEMEKKNASIKIYNRYHFHKILPLFVQRGSQRIFLENVTTFMHLKSYFKVCPEKDLKLMGFFIQHFPSVLFDRQKIILCSLGKKKKICAVINCFIINAIQLLFGICIFSTFTSVHWNSLFGILRTTALHCSEPFLLSDTAGCINQQQII